MKLSAAFHDPRLVSFVRNLAGGGDSSGPSRVLAGSSLGIVLTSMVGSAIAWGMLPEKMRIHWTLGLGPYYGPEFASTLLILILFPVLIAGTAVLATLIDIGLRDASGFVAIQPYYVVAMLGTLVVLLGFQVLLIVANL